MTDYAAEIASVLGTAPSELVRYYELGRFPIYRHSHINCLSFAEAKEYSRKMRGVSVANLLGLWILDDANDSNPYAYISKGACASMIIHFSHDEEPAIKFSSLGSFLDAMDESGSRGQHICDVQPEQLSVPLEDPIRALAAEASSDDRTFLLTTYLAVCAELRGETKAMLVRDKSFFVREALAQHLKQHPRLEDLAFAEELAKDRYAQVARPANAAAVAIRRLIK